MNFRTLFACVLGIILGMVFLSNALAAEWPMWRHDASRSAVSPQELPKQLHLQWVKALPELKPAWPDQPMMPFDASYEPIVVGEKMYIGSSRTDSIHAIDTVTGEEVWRFTTEGPIRFAPVAWECKLYVVSDDGYLYCIDADRGTLIWKLRGGPSDRKILGNNRLISMWPARGAPVIADGVVYFAASIWPFMGIFIHAVDARTGKILWTNDGDGSIYIKQPHHADSFAGVAPQGPMTIVGDSLLVSGGRSVPACYDRKTGKLIHYLLSDNSKRGGGFAVAGAGKMFWNGGYAFELATGKSLGAFVQHPVLTEEVIWGYDQGAIRAYDLANAEIKSPKWVIRDTGVFHMQGVSAMIKAGSRLYAGAENRVVAIPLPLESDDNEKPEWEGEIRGIPTTILAANDRLFVVTKEGRIFCFGATKVEPSIIPLASIDLPTDGWTKKTKLLLEHTKVNEGYCISWGVGSGRLISELARQSKLNIIAIEADAAKAAAVREMLIDAGLYGERVAVIHADPLQVELPPYLASLMVSEDLAGARVKLDGMFAKKAFYSLRPYGGMACLPIPLSQREAWFATVKEAGLENAVCKQNFAGTFLIREGALPGAGNWTHEHADAANTRVSTDSVVKAPLGMLWFGGTSNESILPRHGHGPQPQVIDGRLIIEGMNILRCIDIYTGRLLWEASLPGIGSFYDNLAHQPGANASNTNYISTSDAIYVAYRDSCVLLSPETGRRITEFKLPTFGDARTTPRWGYINVAGDYLIGGAEPLFDPNLLPGQKASLTAANDKKFGAKPENDNLSSSKYLFVMDRYTGKMLWHTSARYGFRHNGICAGGNRLYAIDRLSGAQLKRLMKDDPEVEVTPRIIAFDLKSGAERWRCEDNVFGTWLSYSEKHDVLVESGRNARDTIPDEPKGMRAFQASSGKALWFEKNFMGPAMIYDNMIIRDKGASDLLTGAPKMRRDPITGEEVEWTYFRNYGCNTPMASRHLMTFRSGAAGYCDLINDAGTGNFGGIRSGCTNNLVVAGGIICAPDYTRTCTCSYQNQTSIGLVPMADVEMWTSFGKLPSKGVVHQLGINFGAPGDRKTEEGTLWVEFPSVGGLSPTVNIKASGTNMEYFRRHSSTVAGEKPWVSASGVKGIEKVIVDVAPSSAPRRSYTVRLFFAEPEEVAPGDRVFEVSVQCQKLLPALDIVNETKGTHRELTREFKGILADDKLEIAFTAAKGSKLPPLICGIELIEENKPSVRSER